MKFLSRSLGILLPAIQIQAALAGSGLYYGFEAVSHSLDTHTEVGLSFTPPPPNPSLQRDQQSQSFRDAGLFIGYLFRHRRTQNYFIAPEFSLSTFDSGDAIYATSFKLGTDVGSMRVLVNLGVSRITAFNQNKLFMGLGVEYAINTKQAVSIEWLRHNTIEENSIAVSVLGSQVLTTDTNTGRDIEVIKLSFKNYLLE